MPPLDRRLPEEDRAASREVGIVLRRGPQPIDPVDGGASVNRVRVDITALDLRFDHRAGDRDPARGRAIESREPRSELSQSGRILVRFPGEPEVESELRRFSEQSRLLRDLVRRVDLRR